MKRLIFTAIICAAATAVFAQSSDTSKVIRDTIKNKKGTMIRFGTGEDENYIFINHNGDTIRHYHHRKNRSGFTFGLTLARLDLGFTTIMPASLQKLRPPEVHRR